MTETATIKLPSVPLTTIDNVFAITYQLFDQYRESILLLSGTVMTAWLYNKFWINRKFYPSMQLMQGKTVVITGGYSPIGYETAKDLLRRGARVILVCDDMDQGRQAVRRLHVETDCEDKTICLMECDLCSFDSIRKFAKLYNTEEERLDVLICNANLMWPSNIVTKDGFNSVIQANYLGHFLLTNLLLDKLKKCRPSRIINVSSDAHKTIKKIDWFDALTQFKNYRFWGAYSTSKIFQILSTYKLKHDLLTNEGVNVFALNPGWVWNSNQLPMIQALGFYSFLFIYPFMRLIKIAVSKAPKTGARTTIYCAVEPSLEHSQDVYFKSCAASQPSWLCTHDEYADQLWKLSCEAVDL